MLFRPGPGEAASSKIAMDREHVAEVALGFRPSRQYASSRLMAREDFGWHAVLLEAILLETTA